MVYFVADGKAKPIIKLALQKLSNYLDRKEFREFFEFGNVLCKNIIHGLG